MQRKLARQAAIVFSLKVAGAAVALALHWVIARMYGPAGTGAFFFALTTASLMALVARLGTENQIVRTAAPAIAHSDFHLLSDLRRATNRLILFSATALMIVFLSVVALANAEVLRLGLGENTAAMGIVLAFPAIAVTLTHAEFLRADGRLVWYQIISGLLTPFLASLLLAVAFLVHPIPVSYAALVYVAAAFVTTAIALWLVRRRITLLPPKGLLTPLKLAGSSRDLFLIGLTAALTDWIMMLLLARYTAPEAVGIYSTAARVAIAVSLALASVNVAAAPKFAVLSAGGHREDLQASARHARNLLVLSGLPVVIILAISADWIMGLFGQGFEDGAAVLRVLLLGHTVSLAMGSVGNLLLMSGNERPLLWIAISCTSGMIIAGILILPENGALGAAAVAGATLAARNLLAALVVWQRLGINMFLPTIR